MESTLFDTSVWVNFSKGIENNETVLLEEYLTKSPSSIILTPTIIQEFLMGLSNQTDFDFFRYHFSKLICLKGDWHDLSVNAAKLYFELRKKGITIRKSTDCLIAQVAIENKIRLAHNDVDFDLIAKNSDLTIFE